MKETIRADVTWTNGGITNPPTIIVRERKMSVREIIDEIQSLVWLLEPLAEKESPNA
jgi:hypothetical protein